MKKTPNPTPALSRVNSVSRLALACLGFAALSSCGQNPATGVMTANLPIHSGEELSPEIEPSVDTPEDSPSQKKPAQPRSETRDSPTKDQPKWGPRAPENPPKNPWDVFQRPEKKPETTPETEKKQAEKPTTESLERPSAPTPPPVLDPLPPNRPVSTRVKPPVVRPLDPSANPNPIRPTWTDPFEKLPSSPAVSTDVKKNPPPAPARPTTVVRPAPPSPKKEDENPTWDFLRILTRPYNQAIGIYHAGRLEKPDQLPLTGDGFLKIFQERQRGFGAKDLLSLISEASREIHRDIPAAETVQIGDISGARGGRIGGHGSHQNGLDADLAYFRMDRRTIAPKGSHANATGFDEEFVDRKGNITRNFDVHTNWRFIQLLTGTELVDRIFVDRGIKKAFCEYAIAEGRRGEWKEILRKLRHEDLHKDHMHVRMVCPKNSTKCREGSPIPPGDGCDRLLDVSNGRKGMTRMNGELFDDRSVEEKDPNEIGC